MDIEVSPQNSPTDLAESWDKFQRSMFSQTEPMNIDSVIIVTGLEKESINLSGQGQRIIEDIELCEDEIHEEISRISLGESLHISLFSGRQKEHVLSVEVVEAVNDESHQVDADQSSAKETTSTALCKMMNQETIEVHEARSSRGSIEQPPEEKECVCHGSSSVPNEIHEEFIEGSVEKHDNDNEGKSGFQEKVSLEDERLRVIQPKSRNLDATPPQSLSVIPSKSKNHDATPQSKFQGDLVGKPKQDSTTPESMLIATPAVTEHPPFSRKRRDAIDRMIVLHSKVIKKSLSDTKKLVRLPKESRRTLLAAHCVKRQRESPIYSLPNRFYEPLLPCYSSELQLLLSKEKMKIPNSLKIVETSENLDVSKSPTSGAPLSPSQSSDTLEVGETPMMLVVPESPASGIPKHNATVSQTPPLCPHDTIEIESLERNEVPNLIDEETDSCGANDSELLAGWSGRTRKVASCLHKSFLHASKQREQDKVKFSQAFGGQARKAAARLFYEVLVLKTSGYVDVEQNEAYGDIAMSKLPKLDQTF